MKISNCSVSRSAAFILVAAASAAHGAITMTVTPFSATNLFGSPSATAQVTNVLNSIENGFGNIGNRATDPTAYEAAGATIGVGDVTVSGFNSWRGDANPTGAFAGEFGNRLHFNVIILGGGTNQQFRLNDLSFDMHSSDLFDTMAFVGTFAGLNYNANRYGIDYGADRVKGGGDDIRYTAGGGTAFVDEIGYFGVGNAFDATFEAGATNQDKIDSVYTYAASQGAFTIGCTYSLHLDDGSTAMGGNLVTVIPTPGSLALLGLGGLAAARRRR